MTAPNVPIDTSLASAVATSGPAADLHPPKGVFHDVWVVARRGLVHMKRQPEQLTERVDVDRHHLDLVEP